jgi:DNA-binding response OmpR family regulator
MSFVEASNALRRVLVIEDDVDLAGMLAEALRRSGYDVCVAHRPSEALEAVGRFAPEVALIDLGLPEMDGHALGRRLRGLDPSVTLIALTGTDTASKGERSEELGFDAHLVKPLRIEDLRRVLWLAQVGREG